MATRHQSIFLFMNFSVWSHWALPDQPFLIMVWGAYPSTLCLAPSFYGGFGGFRVLTSCVPLPTGQRGTQESGSLWGRDIS